MKKIGYVLIPILVAIIITGGYFLLNKENIEMFYLDDRYYNNGSFIEVNSTQLDEINGSYVVFTYNYFCQFSTPCEDIFKEYMQKYNIDFISIPFEQFKYTKLHETVTYAPSVIIINNNVVVDYLSTDNDDDIDRYQDLEKFEKWINKYIYTNKVD